LFWKNKQNDLEIFSYNANDRRSSFRVHPPSTEPIRIAFQGKSVSVKDIGGGGLCFCNNNFGVGDSQSIMLDLPGEAMTVCVTMQIIEIDQQDICHGRFVAPNHDVINAIHRYMLMVQKNSLRMKRRVAREMSRSEDRATQARSLVEPHEEDMKGATGLSLLRPFSVD
jgi:hypothetical protein